MAVDMDSSRETESCTSWDNSACEGTRFCPPRCPRVTDDDGTPLLVRPYQPSDFDSLVAMYEAFDGSATTMGLPPFARPRIREWISKLTDDGWNLVAAIGDRIVGHVAVTPVDAVEPKFVVFVHTDFHDRGIGTELLEQLVAYADDRAHDALTLSVATDNHRAITVYENVGFETIDQSELNATMRLRLVPPLTDRVRRPPAER